MGKVLLVVNKC